MEDFARVQRGDFSPADCIRCGRDTDLLDLGAGDKQGYGRPYFCTNCFGELADKMLYISPEEQAASKSALKKQISDRMVERDDARREVTVLQSQLNASPSEIFERFVSDVSSLVLALPRAIGSDAGSTVPVPAEAGAEEAGRRSLDDGADGGVAPAAADRSARLPGGPARAGSRKPRAAAVAEPVVPAGDVADDNESVGAGAPDLDEWVASLGVFDEEAAFVHSGDVGD